MESKEYSWAWVTADRLLSHGPCELVYIMLTSAAAAATSTIYDGENTSGEIIAVLEATTNISQQLHFPKPIYCEHGLYLDIDTNATGCLVQWRELPQRRAEESTTPPSG